MVFYKSWSLFWIESVCVQNVCVSLICFIISFDCIVFVLIILGNEINLDSCTLVILQEIRLQKRVWPKTYLCIEPRQDTRFKDSVKQSKKPTWTTRTRTNHVLFKDLVRLGSMFSIWFVVVVVVRIKKENEKDSWLKISWLLLFLLIRPSCHHDKLTD